MSEPEWLQQSSKNLSQRIDLVLTTLVAMSERWEVVMPELPNIIGAQTINSDGWVGTLVLNTNFDIVGAVAGSKRPLVVTTNFTVDSNVDEIIKWFITTGEWVRGQ